MSSINISDDTNLTGTVSITGTNTTTLQTGLIMQVATKTSDYTLTTSDHICRAEGSDNTITLPSSPTEGQLYYIHNSDSTNTVTIGRNGSNINGGAQDYILNAGDSITIYYNSTATTSWFII